MRSWAKAISVLVASIALAVVAACSGENTSVSVGADGGLRPSSIEGRDCPHDSALTYENFGAPFFLDYCTSCHSAALQEGARQGAPVAANFDTLDGIRKSILSIWRRAGDDHTTMPPAGGPKAEQRKLLGDWLACGAPGVGATFDASSSAPPAYDGGSCAQKREPLPPSMLPRCSSATRACVGACKDEACRNKCLSDDTTPPDTRLGAPIGCAGCVQNQFIACAQAKGCGDAVGSLLCCVQQKCSGPNAAPDCTQTQCRYEAETFSYCAYYVASACGDYYSGGPIDSCFGAAPSDAGGGG